MKQNCVSYPLQKLQKFDTYDGVSFEVYTYLQNNAGHLTLLKTDPFKIPSRYPPSHGVILDVDPSLTFSNIDVSAHFTKSQLCARWIGFNHHENVSLHVGVGTKSTNDNVYAFKPIGKKTSFLCLQSEKFSFGTRFFVLIRAACSGGVTISSSNGVYIYNRKSILRSNDIRIGQRNVPLNECFSSVNSSFTHFSLSKLIIGSLYDMHFETWSDGFTLKSDDARVTRNIKSNDFCFVPFIENPRFMVFGKLQNKFCLRLIKKETEGFVTDNHKLHVFLRNSIYLSTLITEWALIEHSINGLEKSYMIYQSELQNKRGHDFEFIFENITLKENKSYSVGLKLCSKNNCSDIVQSSIFIFERTITPGKIVTSDFITNDFENYVVAHIEVKPFQALSGIVLYQWSISESKDGIKGIIGWRTFDRSNGSNISVKEGLKLPVYPYSTFYCCLKAYSHAGNKILTCTKPNRNSVGTDITNAVYDMDAAAHTWTKILNMIHSKNLGDETHFLFDSELNFGQRSSMVAGVVFHASERNITWYLMSKKRFPSFYQCDSDTECITSLTSRNGYAYFEEKYITLNNVYFICALSKPLDIKREAFIEKVAEIRACSNGFILDEIPPFGGKILVDNIGGFINDLSAIQIKIAGFDDNIDSSVFGYEDNIRSFSYYVGSNSEDSAFHNFTNIGKDRQITSRLDDVKDGSNVVVIIKATDYAGISKTITSKELVVDTSPPETGFLVINRVQNVPIFIDSVHIDLYLTDFVDSESGIDFYEVCLGTQEKACDVVGMKTFQGEHLIYQLPKDIHDGHVYSINARAVNRAGLRSSISTINFIRDLSPPTSGHIIDGLWLNKKDIEFQHDLHSIKGRWNGFLDPQSGIQYYRVGLGTKPYEDNIESMAEVGLQTDITWNASFELGKQYFVSVEACNGANLCSIACSNGVRLDNSPPIVGNVRIGSRGKHMKYLSHNTSVHIQHGGFEDPQSGIHHFEYCIGTQPFSCDICPLTSSLLQSNIIRTGLNLPVGCHLYAMMIAFNKAGLNAKQTSESFIIDNSPPSVLINPKISSFVDRREANNPNIHWEKSLIRIFWKFIDEESSIVKHIVSLMTHQDGHTPIESVVVGNTDTLLINLEKDNWLYDGDIYHIEVLCCNAAGLCTSSESETFQIDSSPPLMGGLAYPMSWINYQDDFNNSRSNISISWYGFVDEDSKIEKYFVTVSKSFNGNELSNGTVIIDADQGKSNHSSKITLTQSISDNSHLIISIWAMNRASLNSSIFRATVFPSLSEQTQHHAGKLKFEKHSCKIHSCNQDCTCSAVGKFCTHSKVSDCINVNTSAIGTIRYPKLEVFGGSENKPEQFSASSACLSGHWKVVGPHEVSILRFEWSMGLFGQKPGDGIFSPSEKQWHDVVRHKRVILCLPRKFDLMHDMKYTVYVKAWYSNNEQFIFSSNPILIDHTPPQTAKGRFIIDSDSDCTIDYDVIDWMDKITFCWKSVFRETQSKLSHFTVSLGTTVNGNDIYNTTNVGLDTNLTLLCMELLHGTKYYFTVTAYNILGLQNSLSSDGFVIDMDKPVAGVVFNTDNFIDRSYQSSTSSFGISWHGFIDHHSGIKTYHVSIAEENAIIRSNITFENVHLKTNHKFRNLKLEHGKRYLALVKAYDAAGHVSATAKSALKHIDVTAPKGLQCEKYVLLRQKEKYTHRMLKDSVPADMNIRLNTFLRKDNLYKFSGTLNGTTSSSKLVLIIERIRVVLYTSQYHDGSEHFEYSFIAHTSGNVIIDVIVDTLFFQNHSLHANLYECLSTNIKAGTPIKIQQIGPSLVKVSALIFDPESSVYKIQYGIGTSPGGLQLRPMSQLYNYQCIIDMQLEHDSKLYLIVLAENHAGLISTFQSKPIIVDKTPPIIRKLNVVHNDSNGEDSVHSVFATWQAEDLESGIKSCYCGLGRGLQMKGMEFLKPTKKTYCQYIVMSLNQEERVYLKVMCINNVELQQELVSEPVIIRHASTNLEFAKVRVLSAFHIKQDIEFFGNKFTEIYLQPNKSRIMLEWGGFEDMYEIDHYEYRFRHHTNKEGEWNFEKTTMIEEDGIDFAINEIYKIDVRAVNSENLTSGQISTHLLVVEDGPELTGNAVGIASFNRTIQLDWSNVFRVPYFTDVVYDVTIGSRRGYSDVVELKRLAEPRCTLSIPEFTTVSSSVNEVVVFVTAKSATGKTAVYEINIKI